MLRLLVRTIPIKLSVAFTVLTIAALSLSLIPESAYAYELWFKFYDINMNEIEDDEEIDIDTLQQGIYVEWYLDCTDGDPLHSFIAFGFSANQTSAIGTSSISDAHMVSIIETYDDDFAEYSEDNAYFIGITHELRYISFTEIHPNASIDVKVGASHYYPPIKNQSAGRASISISVGGGDPTDSEIEEPPASSSEEASDQNVPTNENGASAPGTDAPVDDARAAGLQQNGGSNVDSGTTAQSAADSGKGSSSKGGGSEDGVSTSKSPVGENSTSDKGAAEDASAIGDSAQSNAEGEAGTSSDSGASKQLRQLPQEAKASKAGSQPSDAALQGIVYQIVPDAPPGEEGLSGSSGEVAVGGWPLIYSLLVGLFAIMLPAGLAMRTLRGKTALSTVSRLKAG